MPNASGPCVASVHAMVAWRKLRLFEAPTKAFLMPFCASLLLSPLPSSDDAYISTSRFVLAPALVKRQNTVCTRHAPSNLSLSLSLLLFAFLSSALKLDDGPRRPREEGERGARKSPTPIAHARQGRSVVAFVGPWLIQRSERRSAGTGGGRMRQRVVEVSLSE